MPSIKYFSGTPTMRLESSRQSQDSDLPLLLSISVSKLLYMFVVLLITTVFFRLPFPLGNKTGLGLLLLKHCVGQSVFPLLQDPL